MTRQISICVDFRINAEQCACTRSVPKVRGLPSKLSFLLLDFHEIPKKNVTLMSDEFFGIFYKAE